MRHDCGNTFTRKPGYDGWAHCCICDGRLHQDGCTSKRNKQKDCCPARHKMLFDQGHTRGLSDNSQAMWSEDFPQGYHDPQEKED